MGQLCGQPDLARRVRRDAAADPTGADDRSHHDRADGARRRVARRPREGVPAGRRRQPRPAPVGASPTKFDITRNTAGQLAFGLGPHFCVGPAVARLEAEVVLTALIDRVERIELSGEPVPELNNWLLGLRHLPVTVTPR